MTGDSNEICGIASRVFLLYIRREKALKRVGVTRQQRFRQRGRRPFCERSASVSQSKRRQVGCTRAVIARHSKYEKTTSNNMLH
jgi:hypothetical protein